MTNPRQSLLLAVIVFLAAIAGVWVGRTVFASGNGSEGELHDALHDKLNLDKAQQAKLDRLERNFAVRRRALELELRAGNAKLAAAIEAEHRYGRQVDAAVDQSHAAMYELQKATLKHTFAMRGILRPDQTAKFDEAVVKALTTDRK